MLAWWLVLWGCSATFDIPSDWGSSQWDTATPPCDTTVVATGPVGDAVNRHRHITVDLAPDNLDQAFEVEIDLERDTFRGWETVAGQLEIIEGPVIRVEFVPKDPLLPLTRHAVRAHTERCGPIVEYEFFTSEVGLPVEDPVLAIGLPFVGNAANATLTTSSEARPLLAPSGNIQFVIEDVSEFSTGITLSVQRQPLDIQSPAEDVVLLGGTWDNPTLENMRGDSFPMYMADGIPVELHDPVLTGDLSPDRRQLAGIRVMGELDVRQLSPMIDPDELCSLLSSTGVCKTCVDVQPYCAMVEFRDWTAQRFDPQ
ncbi:MAG: hypothetical protein AAF211_25610 [Myxococcota bacterium]